MTAILGQLYSEYDATQAAGCSYGQPMEDAWDGEPEPAGSGKRKRSASDALASPSAAKCHKPSSERYSARTLPDLDPIILVCILTCFNHGYTTIPFSGWTLLAEQQACEVQATMGRSVGAGEIHQRRFQ